MNSAHSPRPRAEFPRRPIVSLPTALPIPPAPPRRQCHAGRSAFADGKRRSPSANGVRRRQTAFAVGKRRSPTANGVRRRQMAFADGKWRSPSANGVRRRQMAFAVGKWRSPSANGVRRRQMAFAVGKWRSPTANGVRRRQMAFADGASYTPSATPPRRLDLAVRSPAPDEEGEHVALRQVESFGGRCVIAARRAGGPIAPVTHLAGRGGCGKVRPLHRTTTSPFGTPRSPTALPHRASPNT